jgi:hypothetical protein
MARRFSRLLVSVSVCLPFGYVSGFDLRVFDSFSSEALSGFPLLSISLDGEHALLLGARDGSIIQVSRKGLWLSEMVLGLLGEHTPVGHGLAVVNSSGWFYGLIGDSYSRAAGPTAFLYTRSGKRVGDLFFYSGGARLVGLSFEVRPPGGVLHALWGSLGMIRSIPLDEEGRGIPHLRTIRLPSPRSDYTGLAVVPGTDLFFVSLRTGGLLLVKRGLRVEETLDDIWRGELRDQFNLTPLGIRSIEDIAFDPSSRHLFLTDPEQLMVFELAFLPPAFHRGDPDESGTVSLGDAAFILKHLFQGGSAPGCAEAADANNDARIDVTDAIFLLNFLFTGGPPPPAPGPPGSPCGPEPDFIDALAGLGCATYSPCRR